MKLISLILFLFCFSTQTLAVSPTPSPTTTPTATPTTTSDEIQKIREVVQQKVKEKLKLISQPNSGKKAIIGKIIQIDSTQIAIENKGSTQIAKIDADTTYLDKNKNKTKSENLKIGQEVLILGTFDETSFTAKRVILIDTVSLYHKKTTVVGKITDISKTNNVLTLIPINNKNTQYQVKITKTTEFTSPANTDTKVTFESLKSGDRIIAVMSPDPKSSRTYNALKIFVFKNSSQ
ncbi:MAG TPA: hypothetical protein PK639_03090 [Candidatus Woesebacteria bacterium]|nr:hypothetical protein [Candidatus Woesebacteria bacterium]